MFGYVAPNTALLPPEAAGRYRAFYCGLCSALMRRHGLTGRFTLSYDMTFLALLLTSLYGDGKAAQNIRCPVHPFAGTKCLLNPCLDYAADMGIILTYYNLLDHWQDDRSLPSLAAAGILKQAGSRTAAAYPRQSQSITGSLARLAGMERSGILEPDRPAAAFGRLTAELFVMQEDTYSGALRRFGFALGKWIYIMDACVDLRSDLRHARYNPMAACDAALYEKMLNLLASDVMDAFGALPVRQDRALMENILLSGIWSKYDLKRGVKKADGSGSL